MIFYQNYRKQYVNPYRDGVKIGNYNEDIYGRELVEKYSNQGLDPKRFVTESQDKFNWPKPNEAQIKVPGNDITKSHNSNFDLNLEACPENIQDYLTVQEKAQYYLENKNNYLATEMAADDQLKQRTQPIEKSIYQETQHILNKYHIQDTAGIFNTKKEGISNHLLIGHSLDQTAFKQGDFSTTYNLTMNQKERTDKILHPNYHISQQQQYPQKERYDKSDWDFRNFKTYENFTKHYDTRMNTILKK